GAHGRRNYFDDSPRVRPCTRSSGVVVADLIGGRGTRSGGLDVVSLSDHRRGPAARVPRGGGGTHAETGRVHARPQRGGGARGRGECVGGDTMRPGRVPREARGERRRMPLRRPWRSEDRKSTRLNSSHVAISYAVF